MICCLQAGDPGNPVVQCKGLRVNGVDVNLSLDASLEHQRAGEDRCSTSVRQTEFNLSPSFCYSLVLNRLDNTHSRWGGPSAFLSSPMLISSRNTLTDSHRNDLPDNLGILWLTQCNFMFTHNINHHGFFCHITVYFVLQAFALGPSLSSHSVLSP